jgi:hypothetical protein
VKPIHIFRYHPELDAFTVAPKYAALADELGLTEWSPVVWIGRLFTLDADFGEHWFDNWDEREAIGPRARALGFDENELLIIVPSRFASGIDGPSHDDEMRRSFWRDVLRSLTLSIETLLLEAEQNVKQMESGLLAETPDERAAMRRVRRAIKRLRAEVGR